VVAPLGLVFFLLGCAGTAGPGPAAPGGSGGTGVPPAGNGGSSAPPPGPSGEPQHDAGLSDPGPPNAATAADAAPGASDGAAAAPPDTPPGYQGPTAEGQIVYSQDFENDQNGITLSPGNLPASRAMRVDDPLGQRGKVMRVQWLAGDNYRIGQFKPRSNISNTGFHYGPGDTIQYAWGYMTSSTYIGATLAQNIVGGDPIWMIQGRDNGEMEMVPGLTKLPVKLEANRWHDFRAEVHYLAGAAGSIVLFIDGTKVFEHTGGLPVRAGAHWDGGIYITGFGEPSNMSRTVYVSNLSVGKK
jgi:hypothetical protein